MVKVTKVAKGPKVSKGSTRANPNLTFDIFETFETSEL